MKFERHVNNDRSGPMSDIAFLLVIFFLVTSTIDIDSGLGIVLPKNDEETKVRPKNLIQIHLNKDKILLNNTEVALYEVPEVLLSSREESKNVMVSIRSNRSTLYKNYLAVLDEVKHAGINKISILGE